jgi:hypothetical protein
VNERPKTDNKVPSESFSNLDKEAPEEEESGGEPVTNEPPNAFCMFDYCDHLTNAILPF